EAIDKHDVEGALDIPFYYEIITRDETETDTSGLEWTPSHESVGLFHEAGELMEKGMAAMNSGNLEEAITVFENALAIYKGLHRDDMIGPIESTLLNLKLKTKKIAIEDVIAKKQSEAEALNEELKEFIAEENFGAAAGIMEQLADILDSIGQKDQAKKMRAMAASFSGEPSAETKAESEMEKSDAAMAGEKILDQQNASENFESLFEHEHDDAFFGMLGQIKMAILIQEKKMAMEGIIEGNTLLGGFLAAKGEKKAAIPVLESAIQRAIVIGNEILQAKAEAALGEIYLDLGKAAEALDKYEFALRVFDEKKIEGDVVMALDQVGTIYLNRGEPDLAIERFIEAGQRHKEGDTKNLIFKADALGRLGDIYLRLKDLVKASENLEGSLLAYEKVPNSAIYQAIILLKLSIVDSTMGDIEMAIKDVEDSIDFYKQTPDASMFGTLEKKLGEFKARLANPEQSLQDKMSLAEWRFKQQVYLDARELAGELAGELLGKGREKEALGMLLLHGDAAWLTEQYTAAKESYTKAIDLARKIGDDRLGAAVGVLERLEKDMNQPDVKGNMLYEAALASNDDGDKNEAIDKMFDAADQYQLAGKELDRANSLYKASLWLVDAGRKGEAFECLEESARIREAHGNATAAVDSINAAAAIHEQLGEYSLALDMYRKAKDVLARLTPQNDYGQAVCEERIGSMLVNMQQHEQASKVLQHALIVIEKQGNDRMKAIVHRRLGDALRETDVPAALEHYKIAMTLFDAAKDLEGKACTLNSMAVIHDDRCEYDKALEYYDEAARNSAELGDILGHAAYIYNRAAIELIKRDLAVAERHIIEALEVAQKHNIIPYLAPFYETYGDLERTRGAIGKAIEYYKKSETYFVKLNDPDGLAATLADLARAYISSGNVSDAKLAVDRAREAAKATTKKATAAIVRAIEGELAGARGDLATAIRVCTEARSLLAEAGKKVAEAECLERIADFHVKLKNAVAASDAKKQARAIYASLGLTRRIVN
nr:hypothetical protein [Candidatus Sigynarchaeota archaeon]